jgi:hypothetical protein
MKCLFSIVLKVKERRQKEVTGVTGRGVGMTGRIQSELSVCAHLSLVIEHGDTSGHDRPNMSGHVWRLTGNDLTLTLWHSVHQA